MATVDTCHCNIFAFILSILSTSHFSYYPCRVDFLGSTLCRKFLQNRRKTQGSHSLSRRKKKRPCSEGWEEAQGDFLGSENALDLDLGGSYTSVHIFKFLSS